MSADQPLAEGVVGREIVAYFKNLDGRVAVHAKSIGSLSGGLQHDYEITFESGIVQSYRVTWAELTSAKILHMAPLN
jgi:hypothetical protein